MAAYEPKTRKTTESVEDFVDAQPDEQVRDDCRAVIKLMSAATGDKPSLWGSSIVGFGSAPLKYANGSELDWPVCAFSPRKAALTLYLSNEYPKRSELLAKLGKHTTSKGCLYIKRLVDVDLKVLKKMIEASVKQASRVERG